MAQPPVFSNFDGARTISAALLAAAPVVVDANVAIANPDGTGFHGGSLTVSIEDAGAADDLGIANLNGISVVGGMTVGATVKYYGATLGTIVSDGQNGNALQIDLSGDAQQSYITYLLRSITFQNAAATPGERDITVTVTDSEHETSQAIMAVTIDAPPPQPPVFSNFDGARTISAALLAAAPVVVDANVAIANPDGTGFHGGSLTVSIEDAGAADDLGIANLNGISVVGGMTVGATVKYYGATLGTIVSDGQNGNALQIDLSGDAQQSYITYLLRSITFQNAAATPGERDITVTVTDSEHETSQAIMAVTIDAPPPQPPVFSNFDGARTISAALLAAAPVVVDANVAIANPDGTGFHGGSLTVSIEDAGAADDLGIANLNGISVVGGMTVGATVKYYGATLGTIVSDGQNGNALQIDLSGDAQQSYITYLLRSITFQNAAATPGERDITVTVTDSEHETSQAIMAVTIDAPPPQPPVFSNFDGARTISAALLAAAPVVVDANVAIANPDGTGFHGGSLTVSIEDAGAADDLGIANLNGISVVGGMTVGATVKYYGATLGTIVSDGQNGNALQIDLSGDAQQSYITYLLRSITFQNAAATPGERDITVTVTDSEHETSQAIMAVTVSNDPPVISEGSSLLSGAVAENAAADVTPAQNAPVTGHIAFSDPNASDGDTPEASVVPATATIVYTPEGGAAGALPAGFDAAALRSAFSITPAGDWTYDAADLDLEALGSGDTILLTYTVVVTDDYGATDTVPVQITVTGTNDAPEITAATALGDLVEDDDTDGVVEGIQLEASGTITFRDVDLTDSHTLRDENNVEITGALTPSLVTVSPLLPGFDPENDYFGTLTLVSHAVAGDAVDTETVDWSFAVDNAAVQQLAVDQVVTQTYTVKVDDGHGTSATQQISVTITGTNDAAVANDDSFTVVERDDSVILQRDVTFPNGDDNRNVLTNDTDVDLIDQLSVVGTVTAQYDDSTAPVGTPLAGQYGTLTLQTDGSFTYSFLNTNSVIEGGPTLQDKFTYQISDGHDGGSSATLTINIDGKDLNLTITRPPANPLDTTTPRDAVPFVAQDGNDTIYAAADDVADIIYGRDGNDQLYGYGGGDKLYGEAGDDSLWGRAGDDELNGGAGNDVVRGEAGNDTIIGGSGAGFDVYDGGSENDTVDYSSTASGITVDLTPADRLSQPISGPGGLTTIEALLRAAGYLDPLPQVGWAFGTDIDTDVVLNIENVIGGTGPDTITGDANGNILRGGLGLDTLHGGAGADTLYGGGGNDTLYGDADGDTLYGEEDDDTLWGGNGTGSVSGVDTLHGGAGADTLHGEDGNDTLYGDGGNDVLYGENDDDILWGGNGSGAGSGNDTLHGGAGNDTLHGEDGNDALYGDAGNDAVHGDAGNDTIFGGLVGGDGDDVYDGGDDNDTVDYSSATATAVGVTVALTAIVRTGEAVSGADGVGSNPDTIGALLVAAGYLADTPVGRADGAGIGTDVLLNIENVIGSSGDDTIVGDDRVNVLDGGNGNDSIWGGAGNDEIRGGQGNDILVGGFGSEAPGSGNDTIYGGDGDDQLFGEDGDDILWGGIGADQYAGGAGRDTLYFDGDNTSDTAWGGTQSDTFVFLPGFGVDTIKDFLAVGVNGDKIDLSAFPGLTFAGLTIQQVGPNNQNVQITSAAFGTSRIILEVVNAGAVNADDFIFASPAFAASFAVNATGGDDTPNLLLGDTPTQTLDQSDAVQSSVSFTLGTNGANLTLTGSTNINGTGNALANVIRGNSGNNTLSGLGGDDTLFGGAGHDTLNGGGGSDHMFGGAGNDTYIVADAGDTVGENANEGTDTVQSSITFTLGDNVENLTLTGAANINGTGNALANVITGNSGRNIINGGSGNDTLSGGAGVDTVSYEGAGGGVTVSLATANAQNTGLSTGIDRLSGFENLTGSSHNDILTGSTGNNVLNGLAGDDRLSGGGGDDTLIGGAGNDTLTGGTGRDAFVFDLADPDSGFDTIIDFSSRIDSLHIAGTGLAANAIPTLVTVSDVNAAADAGAHFIFETSSGNIYWDANGGSSADAIVFAKIAAGATLLPSDFHIV